MFSAIQTVFTVIQTVGIIVLIFWALPRLMRSTLTSSQPPEEP
jgi:threonine/homoserine/homoserine lactone efflux protein